MSLGDAGKLVADLKWTHLLTWRRVDADGTVYNFAGTHGNCDTTNCNGTPADRVNLGLTWERGDWRVAALANHRAAISARTERDDPNCAVSLRRRQRCAQGLPHRIVHQRRPDLAMEAEARPRTASARSTTSSTAWRRWTR
jgi:hypothetical protein